MINTTVIQGNITADIELKQTPSGIAYARFNVAINERTKDAEKTYFFPVQAWRHTAEFIAKYFRKGSQIAIEGKLTQRTYTGSDGVKRNVVEVVANSAHFCGSKNGSSAPAPQQQAAASAPAADNGAGGYSNLAEYEEILSDGDVPF